ncbi:Fic family protein [Amycolatopsis sp. NPDC005961]|uniref:Fic family protein n=1 Tax=Amycolatopsis sp. NPDC005961 TaxID=3156720 RepID=UPI0033EC7FC4
MKTPMPPPDIGELFASGNSQRMVELLMKHRNDAERSYLPWDKMRYKTPPEGLTHEEWWLVTRVWRESIQRETSLHDMAGGKFTYALPDGILKSIDYINTNARGQITISEQVTNHETRDRYLVSSLIEEAITSSQLEGASTEHRVAKEMLRSGRSPRDRSEKMIYNNYLAMRQIGDYRDEKLTVDLIREIHRIVTEGTLENPDAAGRFQLESEDRIAVYDEYNKLLHSPPPASEIPDRIQELCDFANGAETGAYLPPVLRAITVHFMIGYIHPFEDGNGRTARTLFYWSMLNQGYWLTEYLTVSRILKKAPSKYGRSYLLTEHDRNDLTYFYIYQLGVIERSIKALHEHLARKMDEVREIARSITAMNKHFNHRQLALLQNAVENKAQMYTVQSHSHSHRASPETARKDLMGLEDAGLLIKTKSGRANAWMPASDIVERLNGNA